MRIFYILLSTIILFHTAPLKSEDLQKTSNATALNPDQKIICLVMTLENDEQVIASCLNSAAGIVDCFCICDNGSTDKTLEIAGKLIEKSKIPAKVFKQKTGEADEPLSAIIAAKRMIGELNYSPSNVYFLFLDADKHLVANRNFKKENLPNEEACLILQNTLDFFFYRPCLIQASMPAEKIRTLCECSPFEKPNSYETITGLMVKDQQDNQSGSEQVVNSEKIGKNIVRLIRKLKDDPDNTNDMISLAQSYKSLKNYEEAIKWHRAHLKKCEIDECFWFSNYKMAECYKEQGRWDLAIQFYLEALQYAPDRYESLKKISEFYRQSHRNEIAYVHAKHASNLQRKEGHYLFTFNPTENHQMDDELSFIAYYVKRNDEGLAAINRLLLGKNVPQKSKNAAYRNMIYYVDKLEKAEIQPISIRLPRINEETLLTYNPMNSSIKRTDSGYKLIFRTVNYIQSGGCDFHSLDPSQNMNTINFLVELDKDLKTVSQHEIVNNIPKQLTPAQLLCRVKGMEDCRLVQSAKEDWFTCSTCDTSPTGHIQVTMCKLSDQTSDQKIQVEKFTPLNGPDPLRHEKNWLSFMLKGQCHAIYSYDPMLIYKLDKETGSCAETHRIEQVYDFSQFRGSAGPVELNDGYLVLIHEVVLDDKRQRNYIHRFLFMDKDFIAKKISKPFVFMHKGIEFCCGMTLDHAEKNLIMGVSIEDRLAFTFSVDLETIDVMLEPLPKI